MANARSGLEHRLFQITVAIKGVDGALEILGGLLLLIFGAKGVNRTLAVVTEHEATLDQGNFFVRTIIGHAHPLPASSVHLTIIYLLVNGVVKIWLVHGLLKELRWMFPVAMGILGLLVAYLVVHLTRHPSASLAFFAALDVITIALVWREYLRLPKSA